VIQKKSGGICHSGREIRTEGSADLSRIKEKTRSDGQQHNEIKGKFNAGTWTQILSLQIGSVIMFI